MNTIRAPYPHSAAVALSNPLTPFVVGVTIIGTVLLALLFGGYLYAERQSRLRYGEVAAEQIAGFTAISAEGRLDSLRQILRGMTVLARRTGDAGYTPEAVSATLRQWKLSDPQVMDLLVLSPSGRILIWTGHGESPAVADRPYYQAHLEQPDSALHISAPMLSRVHPGRWFFSFSEGLRDEGGNLTHIVVAILDADRIRDRLATRLALPRSTQALLGEDGRIFMRMPEHEKHVGQKVSRPAEFSRLNAVDRSATFHRRSQLDGRARILSFYKVAGYPLIAAGTVDIESLLQAWRNQAIALALLWLVLTAAVVWFALRLKRIGLSQAQLAGIDSLTGTFNRRMILSAGSQLRRSSANTDSLSLLMIDADNFKAINDRFGHVMGDEVLRQLAEVLRENVRSQDIVGRYGGEEFLVLMPDTAEEGARRVAEKLRAIVESNITRPTRLTISVGVATTTEVDLTLEKALALADAALYAAKNAGRNCVRVASTL